MRDIGLGLGIGRLCHRRSIEGKNDVVIPQLLHDILLEAGYCGQRKKAADYIFQILVHISSIFPG